MSVGAENVAGGPERPVFSSEISLQRGGVPADRRTKTTRRSFQCQGVHADVPAGVGKRSVEVADAVFTGAGALYDRLESRYIRALGPMLGLEGTQIEGVEELERAARGGYVDAKFVRAEASGPCPARLADISYLQVHMEE